jgi:capsular polysaccharide biosynthesis protein
MGGMAFKGTLVGPALTPLWKAILLRMVSEDCRQIVVYLQTWIPLAHAFQANSPLAAAFAQSINLRHT